MTYPEHSVEQDQQNFEKPQSGHGGQRFAHFAKFFLFSFVSFVSFCFTGFHRTSFNFTKLHFLLTQKGINFLTCKVIVLGGFLSNHFIQEALKFWKKKKEAVNNNSKFAHALHWAFTFCNISYFLDGSSWIPDAESLSIFWYATAYWTKFEIKDSKKNVKSDSDKVRSCRKTENSRPA